MSATGKTATKKRYDGFSDEERAAMKDRVREQKVSSPGADLEAEVLAKIAGMDPPDRAMAERIHAVVKATDKRLTPRLWYGMPAYASGGKLICFFQPAKKFKTRYATFGFSDAATLDDGNMWPNGYAVTKVTATEEAKIRALLKRALG